MPVLTQEPCSFPENLLDDPIDVQQSDSPASDRVWWVVYTKSRQEKSLARDLLGYRIPFYLPQVPRDHLVRGRRVRAMSPCTRGTCSCSGRPTSVLAR